MSGNALGTCWSLIRRRRKKRQILGKIRQLPRRSVVLAEDETHLLSFPPLRAGWTRRGEPFYVPITGRNARRTVFGAINLRNSTRLLLAQRYQRADEFQEFLEMVHWYYRNWHVALLLDEDSSHTADESQILAEDLHIDLLWLPNRSPQLNPMDQLWRKAKDDTLGNYQYPSIDVQVKHFLDYIFKLSPRDTLLKAGVLSQKFWLKGAL